MKTKMLMVLCLALAPMGCKDSKRKIEVAQTRMQSIRMSVDMYYITYDEYPDNLQALLKPPAGRQSFLSAEQIKDPWGERFNYANRGGEVRLSSSGPDKKENTEDDVWFTPPEHRAPELRIPSSARVGNASPDDWRWHASDEFKDRMARLCESGSRDACDVLNRVNGGPGLQSK